MKLSPILLRPIPLGLHAGTEPAALELQAGGGGSGWVGRDSSTELVQSQVILPGQFRA